MDEILEVLKQIRDEARQTNVRLESLEGRLEFLEHRIGKGFDELSDRIDAHVDRLLVQLALMVMPHRPR